MAKLYPMIEEYVELIKDVMLNDAPSLDVNALHFEFTGTPKQNAVIKVSKAGENAEYLSNSPKQIVMFTIYEKAFEKLDETNRKLLISHAVSSIDYNSENDKLTIEGGGSGLVEGVYLKYKEPSVLAIFNGKHAIRQIIEEEAELKKLLVESRKLKNKKQIF